MKKWYCIIFIVLFMFWGIAFIGLAQDAKRMYNDGVIDYAPLSASFVLNAEDTESTLKEIQYSVDGASLEVYKNPISFTTEGRHVIVYRAVDLAGNISPEKIYSVIIDATPPDGLASVDGPSFLKDNLVYITGRSKIILWAEDNLSGVDKIYVKLDDGTFVPYSRPVTISSEGYHTASAYVVDNVGNRTNVFSIRGYVDNTPPEVTIVPRQDFIIVNGKNYTNKENEYKIESYDAISGTKELFVSLDGSPWVTYTGAFKLQWPGEHELRAKAVDNVGNESIPVSTTFFVDVKPPKSTIGASVGN